MLITRAPTIQSVCDVPFESSSVTDILVANHYNCHRVRIAPATERFNGSPHGTKATPQHARTRLNNKKRKKLSGERACYRCQVSKLNVSFISQSKSLCTNSIPSVPVANLVTSAAN